MLTLTIDPQPDDETCGPTCLRAIYNYYGKDLDLKPIVQEIDRSLSGGTLAPMLGKHALKLGFSSTLHVNNISIFDPSWFQKNQSPQEELVSKLVLQNQYKKNPSTAQASKAYQRYLELGGQIRHDTINLPLMQYYFQRQIPLLVGLSATYLYSSPREHYTEQGVSLFDDIRGTPCGHFVILYGYDEKENRIFVADPNKKNRISSTNYYKIDVTHLINAIMLGVLTYDSDLLVIHPKRI